jgi:hypothetical protein
MTDISESGIEAAARRLIRNLPSIIEDHVCGGSDTRPVVDIDGLVGALTENVSALIPTKPEAKESTDEAH